MTAATPDSAISRRDPETRLARIRVDYNAVVDNWRYFQRLAKTAEVAAVVKADAYGLGAVEASRALAQAGARTFFTMTCSEGLAVRNTVGAGARILVLNGPTGEDAVAMAAAQLTPVLNSLHQIKLWNGRGPAVLHIDTGMNRLGVGADEVAPAAAALRGVDVTLVISHLACASDAAHAKNAVQRERFLEACALFPSVPRSLAATGGALLGDDYHFDLMRIGVGLYGSGALDRGGPHLATVATIEAPILQVRDTEPGESFGYGATFTATRKMRAATVALGYADGYLRVLGGRGYGVLDGARCPILGRISMDLTIIDVTGCNAAREGAMVEFLGANAHVDDVAALAGTAAYEILTTFAGAVRRTGARA
ncbi:MAG: alanine racemase [Hyphomonadaceae bacterium]|nr:alanine racemase [Hyphomonadaceae bacterium]